MILEEAIELIRYKNICKQGKQCWADLGCGSGTFTKALADLLSPGSVIYAVDKNKYALDKIPEKFRNATIKKIHGDFITTEMPFILDGIIMGNSLHFVKDKTSFIKNIEKHLKERASILIVEYDIDMANPWVPFPVSFRTLKQLFENFKFSSIIKINERSSLYQRGLIYSAIIHNVCD